MGETEDEATPTNERTNERQRHEHIEQLWCCAWSAFSRGPMPVITNGSTHESCFPFSPTTTTTTTPLVRGVSWVRRFFLSLSPHFSTKSWIDISSELEGENDRNKGERLSRARTFTSNPIHPSRHFPFSQGKALWLSPLVGVVVLCNIETGESLVAVQIRMEQLISCLSAECACTSIRDKIVREREKDLHSR